MIEYALEYPDKLLYPLLEHIQMLVITLMISLILAAFLTIISIYSRLLSKTLVYFFSVIYAVPSIALFALLIPLTGLGKTTAIIVLVLYNQYVLLRNFLEGLDEVDPAVTEAATGIGMTKMQLLIKIKIPLSKRALFTGIRISVVTTIGIATIAAFINAGGLGSILNDGLRTVNTVKILWGSILAAGLAIVTNTILSKFERKL
ncbi:osmoprotectant transport system permease protein [Gracilibacillus ureilyticus]|uniref:Osmoprotectant transport system permease protein n=1 Tax=Gracilibacillus ureilyticus TaxID=531814 RepID=A0A1H9T9D3_9BACI|nr:ABC transporter permease [Gracilibacillus ureilyticus]SER93728.1 osmoprotectant transport system permease protein [Gracilibacillus ureilyticus]